MPQYLFENDDTGEVREVFYGMNDVKNYKGKSGKEKWTRIYISPQACTDTAGNPFSATHYMEKTKNMKTMGQLFDYSAELSRRRKQITGGEDPIVQKHDKERQAQMEKQAVNHKQTAALERKAANKLKKK